MAWTLIQLLTVLLIFSSEKPARSYCQDLIKDLKAVVMTGCVSSAVMIYHTADEHQEREAH